MAPANAAQDNVQAFVTAVLGRARVNTVACFGRYIGEKGTHFTPGRYVQMGFHGTCVFDGPRLPGVFPVPTTELIEGVVSTMAAIFAEAYRAGAP